MRQANELIEGLYQTGFIDDRLKEVISRLYPKGYTVGGGSER
jgi:hypothetical protein